MADTVAFAGVQWAPELKRVESNVDRMLDALGEAAGAGAQLVVYPECATTGYYFESAEEARSVAESLDGPTSRRFTARCAELGIYAVYGFLELDDEAVYNAAAIVGPSGVVGRHRKVHVPPSLGDRFFTKGNFPYQVHDTPVGTLGVSICYDIGFPEGCRTMALMGADLLLLPTNWPVGAERVADHMVITRAIENKVNYAAVNRCGTEAGFRYIGHSQVVDHLGRTLAEAGDEETIIYAEVDLAGARQKQMTLIPGVQELNRIEDRRPEFYGLVAAPKASIARS